VPCSVPKALLQGAPREVKQVAVNIFSLSVERCALWFCLKTPHF
jgi:hypothetical protein